MSLDRLFGSHDEFFRCVDEGMKLAQAKMPPPDEQDKEALKSLLAVFITATIEMDPKSVQDPDMSNKLLAVRMALLAAYHLGKKSV